MDYDLEDGIYNLKWPAAWCDDKIPLSDHIEAVMHLLFLCVAKSNQALLAEWLKNTKGQTKKALLQTLQNLIVDLLKFRLSWLALFPLTRKKRGELGYGSWVSENWSSLVRLSAFLHL